MHACIFAVFLAAGCASPPAKPAASLCRGTDGALLRINETYYDRDQWRISGEAFVFPIRKMRKTGQVRTRKTGQERAKRDRCDFQPRGWMRAASSMKVRISQGEGMRN